ncbi:MAG: hypothetical protein Q3999_08400 [Buchananella hordeovulneris]|nr:hypothetical protein [Buchananella hordeovulneris]
MARIFATAEASPGEPVFALHSALALWGVEGWVGNPDVVVRDENGNRTTRYPEVQVEREVFPAVKRRRITGLTAAPPVRIHGVLAERLQELAFQFAARTHPLEAVVAISGIMRQMAQPGPGASANRAELAAREPEVREALLSKWDQGVPQARPVRSRLALAASSALCESVGERVMLYLLSTLTSAPISPQLPVTVQGKQFYLDFALPEQRTAVEFDGVGKLGTTDRQFNDEKQKWAERQGLLLAAGWKLSRFTWKDIFDLPAARARLALETGLDREPLGEHSRLWVPPPLPTRQWRMGAQPTIRRTRHSRPR